MPPQTRPVRVVRVVDEAVDHSGVVLLTAYDQSSHGQFAIYPSFFSQSL
jgi:hypothetical protein